MKTIPYTHRGKKLLTPLIFICYSLLITHLNLNAQSIPEIYKLENPHFSLQKKISIALSQSIKEKSISRIWLGYIIQKETATDRFYYFPNQKCINQKSPRLHEAIHEITFQKDNELSIENKPSTTTGHHLPDIGDFDEIIIFMDYYLESGRPKLMQIFASSLNARFDLRNKPVYWLGKASQKESIDWLKYVFAHDSEITLGNQIINGLASHPPDQKIYHFLNQVLFNNKEIALKESVIFCLGNYSTTYSDNILSKFIKKSRSANLSKKAIIALSQSNSPQAIYLLSSIAIRERDKSIRKEAIFSLSQIEHQKSLQILQQIVFKDKNPDIQDFTVFALGQMQHPAATNILYQLSETHPNIHVRKKALFWIGKQRNQKALR